MAWGWCKHKEQGRPEEVSGILQGWRTGEHKGSRMDRSDLLLPECGWLEWGPDLLNTPVQPKEPMENGQPSLLASGSRGPFSPTISMTPSYLLMGLCLSPPWMPELLSRPLCRPLLPISSLSSLCCLGPGPLLSAAPFSPCPHSPCGFFFPETLSHSGLSPYLARASGLGRLRTLKGKRCYMSMATYGCTGFVYSGLYSLQPLALVCQRLHGKGLV